MNTHFDRLIELSSNCKEFGGIPITPQEAARKKGQTPQGNVSRAVGTNLFMPLASGYIGVPASVHNAVDAEAAGQVYRKRDAYKDGWKQTGSIIGGVAAAGAAGAGGSLAGHKIEEKLAERAGRNLMISPSIVHERAQTAGLIGAGLGLAGGAIGGYKWARNAGKKRIESNKQMSALDRLTELSRKIEMGFFNPTKQVPDYEDGQFNGMKTSVNPVGVVGDIAAAGAVGGAGYLGHKAVMGTYGQHPATQGLNASLGGGAGKPMNIPVKDAYANLGNDLKAGAKSAWTGASQVGSKLGPAGSKVSGLAGILGKLRNAAAFA